MALSDRLQVSPIYITTDKKEFRNEDEAILHELTILATQKEKNIVLCKKCKGHGFYKTHKTQIFASIQDNFYFFQQSECSELVEVICENCNKRGYLEKEKS